MLFFFLKFFTTEKIWDMDFDFLEIMKLSSVHVFEMNCSTFYYTQCMFTSLNLFKPKHDKSNKMLCAPREDSISRGIPPVRSESSLSALWVAKDQTFY